LTSFFESLRCVGAGVLAACVAAGFAFAAGALDEGPSTPSGFAPFVAMPGNRPESFRGHFLGGEGPARLHRSARRGRQRLRSLEELEKAADAFVIRAGQAHAESLSSRNALLDLFRDRQRPTGGRIELLLGNPDIPELSGRSGGRPVEEELGPSPAAPAEVRVFPDLEVPRAVAAFGEPAQLRRFAVRDHHPTRVVPPAVVLFVGQQAQLFVSVSIPRAERWKKARLLAPSPERFLEGLALVRLGELQIKRLFLGLNDRRDELGQPLAVVLWQRGKALLLRRLSCRSRRCGDRRRRLNVGRRNNPAHRTYGDRPGASVCARCEPLLELRQILERDFRRRDELPMLALSSEGRPLSRADLVVRRVNFAALHAHGCATRVAFLQRHAVFAELLERLPTGAGMEHRAVRSSVRPENARLLWSAAVEEVPGRSLNSVPDAVVSPDLEVLESELAGLELLDGRGLTEADHEPAGVVSPAVVFLVRRPPPLLVATPVARAHRKLEPLALAARPESLFEDLALVRFGQLEKEPFFLGKDDRGDGVRQPLALLFRKRGDPLFSGGLVSRALTRTGPGDQEGTDQEKEKCGSLHPRADFNPPIRAPIP
jgi:hypothetical protein